MLANHKREIPFVILLMPFLFGIGLELYMPSVAPLTAPIILLVCLAGLFISLNISYGIFNLYKVNWLGGILIHAILFCAGWFCAANYNDLHRDDHFSKQKAQYLVATITNEPTIKNGSIRFAAAVNHSIDSNKRSVASGNLLVSIKDSAAFGLKYGDILVIPSSYSTVDPPFNPAEFNYKQYLANKNIYQQIFLYPGQYAATVQNDGNKLISLSLRLRKKLADKFSAAMHDSSAISVASTMILGYKADLSDDVLQAYANTGTLHVLSVSGAHVAIVFLLLSSALSFLNKIKHGKLIKTLTIIIMIWAYALLTGFSPAVNRAALMISLVILGNNFYRYINPLNLLAASAFALLLYNPYYLIDVGFQLSYLAVTGLIVFQPLLYKSMSFNRKWQDKLWSLCSFSIAAQIITFPLSVYYFHQFPVYFLLSNLFILLPVVGIMYLGLLFLMLSWLPFVSEALAYLLEQCIVLMNDGLRIIEHLPYASFNKLWIGTEDYLLMYAVIVLFFYFIHNRNRRLLNLSLVLLLIISVNTGWKKIGAKNTSAIIFLNMKKQRAIIFRNGNDAIVLSDLTPADKNYRYSIQPGLDSVGIEHVKVYNFADSIVLPHFRKAGSLIRFERQNIVLLDSSWQNINLTHRFKADYIYITRTPPVTIDKINQNFDSRLLVISADNSDRYIDTLKKQLLVSRNKYYNLERNKALNLVSH